MELTVEQKKHSVYKGETMAVMPTVKCKRYGKPVSLVVCGGGKVGLGKKKPCEYFGGIQSFTTILCGYEGSKT